MTFESIISWIICGLIVGLISRFLVPGRQSMSIPMTVLLGIGGALLGGFLYSQFRGVSVDPFSLARHNWYGWIVSIMGGMLVVWIYPFVFPRKWWQ
ncbi:MAG: GlsB/YeaQ/YmgE family stress response membrane protein [Planctomycetota bacterium]